ncbi:hypothetical protein PS862_01160 [Pseudomonas fluorescens]|uniref:Uncharacterized protein n=1 Tax=Pseudomonas fluorescens TaxID=294 RepID=A0A5E7HUH0_PSEFL|nr:FAD-dependent oxidoreductase [Pseudomonas fluorescens]VVO67670.1 hypothetical protein PS862_01160 [Pseudomonas fluorescens]
MKNGQGGKKVAVFSDGIDALLYGYYLQRFGVSADVFFSDSSAPNIASNHLVSTWLCLQREPMAKKIAVQGIAELREIAIDLGAKVLASDSGTIIFEHRSDFVESLEQFARACRAQGLLVEVSRNAGGMGLPFGTLAAVRFMQDVSIYPRTLSNRLMESFLERGGAIYRERNFDQLRIVDDLYEMVLGGVAHYYDTVVVGGNYSPGSNRLGESPRECPESSMGIFGRYLSFERAAQIQQKMDERPSAQPKRSFFEHLLKVGKEAPNQTPELPSWAGIHPLSGVKNGYIVGQSGELAHCIAAARALAEYVSSFDELSTHEHSSSSRNVSAEPQSIPWII